MKFLSLLGAVYADWFTVRKKFTLCVALIFFLTSFVMTFTASLTGGSVFWTDPEIDIMLHWYQFYDNTISYLERTPYGKTFAISFIDNFSAVEKGNLASASLKGDGYLIDAGDDKYTYINVLPYFAETEGRRDFLSHTSIYEADGVNKLFYYDILDGYTLADGRLINDDDFNSAAHVIVLPESLGLKVGDTVNFSFCDLEVVGLTSKNRAEMPATTFEEIANYYSQWTDVSNDPYTSRQTYTCGYGVDDVTVNRYPISEQNRLAIQEGVRSDTGIDDFVFLQFTPPSNDLEYAYIMIEGIYGTVVAIFSVLCVYNVALRLCASTMPMMQLFKLCGMKRGKVILILSVSLFSLLAVCFALACLAIVATKPLIQSITTEYVVRELCFIISALLMTAASLIALLPRIVRLAGSKVSNLTGGENQ